MGTNEMVEIVKEDNIGNKNKLKRLEKNLNYELTQTLMTVEFSTNSNILFVEDVNISKERTNIQNKITKIDETLNLVNSCLNFK